MRILGIDYGRKNIGIALSDPTGAFALPHGVFENDQFFLSRLLALIKEKGVGRIVIGESKDLSGAENPVQKEIHALRETLSKESGLTVVLEPEFYTTQEAERIQGKGKAIDASAAALILQSYIDKM